MKLNVQMKNQISEEDSRSEIHATDFWKNKITFKKISSSDFSVRILTKTFENQFPKLTEQQKLVFQTIINNIQNPFLQMANFDLSTPDLTATFDFDTIDFASLLAKMSQNGKKVTERHILVILRALIELGDIFQNNFCFLTHMSLESLKVLSMKQKYLFESKHGLRVENPFFSDDYLNEMISVN